LDISGISKLIQNVLGTSLDENFWRWKYCNNPTGNNFSAIALFKGEIVGLLGALKVKFSVDGKDIIGIQEVDNAILEKHRNFMLYLNMAKSLKKNALEANIKFAYAISIEDTSEIAKTILGKNVVSSIPRLVKVLDVKPFLQQRIPNQVTVKIISRILNWANKLRSSQQYEIPDGMMFKKIDRFDKRFDEFWERIKTSYPIMVKRDSDYLNWRYASHPYIKFNIICVEQIDTKKIMGYIVLAVKQDDYLVGNIVDLITPKDKNRLIEKCLIRSAINWFYAQKVAVIRCWMFPHCHIYPELMKAGFVSREKEGVNLLFQKINDDFQHYNSLLSRVENWHLAIGDSDNL
jgi:hypothetical protein